MFISSSRLCCLYILFPQVQSWSSHRYARLVSHLLSACLFELFIKHWMLEFILLSSPSCLQATVTHASFIHIFTWLPAILNCDSSIMPSSRLLFHDNNRYRHDWSSMSPKEPMLHLSSSPCTGYQWQLASSSRHWCLHTERPQAQHPPTSTHYYESTSPPEVWDLLVSDALWYHHRGSKSLSRTFSFTVPGWWNNLPTPIRNAGSLSIFKQQLKTHLFRHYLTSS